MSDADHGSLTTNQEGISPEEPNIHSSLKDLGTFVGHEVACLSIEALGMVGTEAIIIGLFWILEKMHGSPFPPFVEAFVTFVELVVFFAFVALIACLHLTRYGKYIKLQNELTQRRVQARIENTQAMESILQTGTPLSIEAQNGSEGLNADI